MDNIEEKTEVMDHEHEIKILKEKINSLQRDSIQLWSHMEYSRGRKKWWQIFQRDKRYLTFHDADLYIQALTKRVYNLEKQLGRLNDMRFVLETCFKEGLIVTNSRAHKLIIPWLERVYGEDNPWIQKMKK